MLTINHILVDLDPTQDLQPALNRAIEIAKQCDASIELFLAVHNSSIVSNWFINEKQLEHAKEGYIQSKRRWLQTYLDEVLAQGIKATMDVVWHKPFYRAILQKIESSSVELVVKSTHTHPGINKIFFTPSDWQLLKACPIPLLLVKQKQDNKRPYKNIMACVDPIHTEGKYQDLNQAILETMSELESQMKLKTHALHCSEPMGIEIWQAMPEMGGLSVADHQEYLDNLMENHRILFNKLMESYPIKAENTFVKTGDPISCVPQMVEEKDIDLLIMGSNYHTGLIGGTAEKLLDEVNCDILAVKSVNFEKPL